MLRGAVSHDQGKGFKQLLKSSPVVASKSALSVDSTKAHHFVNLHQLHHRLEEIKLKNH